MSISDLFQPNNYVIYGANIAPGPTPGDFHVVHDLVVGHDATIGTDLIVGHDITAGHDITSTHDIISGNNISAVGTGTFHGITNIGTLTNTGAISETGNVTITGNITNVTGTSAFNGITNTGTLANTGALNEIGNLTVTGNITNVTGTSAFNGITNTGALNNTGAMVETGNLSVTGTISSNSNINGLDIKGNKFYSVNFYAATTLITTLATNAAITTPQAASFLNGIFYYNTAANSTNQLNTASDILNLMTSNSGAWGPLVGQSVYFKISNAAAANTIAFSSSADGTFVVAPGAANTITATAAGTKMFQIYIASTNPLATPAVIIY